MKRDRDLRKKIGKDSRLTPFQRRVLLAVMDIPRGEVRSYAWVSARAGSPRAFRSAGRALAKNPYAPEVPCHRIIASDGSIGGYSRGIRKKRELLKKEGIRV